MIRRSCHMSYILQDILGADRSGDEFWIHKRGAREFKTGRSSTSYAKYHNILTIIGHCIRHQPGLDESSGRDSTTFLHGIAFRFYLVFSKVGKTLNWAKNAKTDTFPKGMLSKKTNACGKPETP